MLATLQAEGSSYVAAEAQLAPTVYYECMRGYSGAAHMFAVMVIGALHYATGRPTEIAVELNLKRGKSRPG